MWLRTQPLSSRGEPVSCEIISRKHGRPHALPRQWPGTKRMQPAHGRLATCWQQRVKATAAPGAGCLSKNTKLSGAGRELPPGPY